MGKRVAIFLHGQNGDVMEASSVLRYKDELWGEDCEITWFIQDENRDLFKHNPYLKLKQFPHGYGIPESDMNTIYAERIAKDKADGKPEWFDLSLVKTHDNKLDTSKKDLYEPIIGSFDVGYFPAPHQMAPEQRQGLEYSLCSKLVFGVPDYYEWHPVLYWTDGEKLGIELVKNRIGDALSDNKKIILIESYCGSGQSIISEELIKKSMDLCRMKWLKEGCFFVFVSHKYLNSHPEYPDWIENGYDTFTTKTLSVREVALFNEIADLMICISSGISVATSAWNLKPTVKIQYCGSKTCSTSAIANGDFHLVESDFKSKEVADKEFISKLETVLETI
jgi:hypothetical protein